MKEKKQADNPLQEQSKKAYQKPILNKVQLVAEEAVLALCKLGNVSSRTSCQAHGDQLCRYTATS